MSKIGAMFAKLRFVLIAVCVALFSSGAFAACATNEIDVNGDGTNCQTNKFSVTTTNDATSLNFSLSAQGTFYVDCGDGGTLTSTGNDVSGKTITRSDTTNATYTCTWDSAGAHTVKFGSDSVTAYNTSTSTAAISFYQSSNGTQAKIASIDGSLGAMFPVVNGNIPRFYKTFSKCTNLTQIPAGLFDSIDTSSATDTSFMFSSTFLGCTNLTQIPAGVFDSIDTSSATNTSYMFSSTFQNCPNLTQIPAGLFDSIDTNSATNTSYMFQYTFRDTQITSIPSRLFSAIDTSSATDTSFMFSSTFLGCTNLTQIPAGVFDSIDTSSATNTSGMFYRTFQNCPNLTQIPAGLFDSIDTSSATNTSYMFEVTFRGCTNLTQIPAGLFDSIDTSSATSTNEMFYYTFNGCTNLTQIPAGLFDSIDTSSATSTSRMFFSTFNGCTNLTGYIPPTAFPKTIKPGTSSSSYMWHQTFSGTNLDTTCPAGTTEYNSGFENDWGYSNQNTTTDGTYRVSCEPCTGTLPGNATYTTGTCNWSCNTGYGLTDTNACAQLCTAGVTQLHTSTGLAFNLYANKLTSPAVHIKTDTGAVCYVNLATGNATNAINVQYNNTTYHTTN